MTINGKIYPAEAVKYILIMSSYNKPVDVINKDLGKWFPKLRPITAEDLTEMWEQAEADRRKRMERKHRKRKGLMKNYQEVENEQSRD